MELTSIGLYYLVTALNAPCDCEAMPLTKCPMREQPEGSGKWSLDNPEICWQHNLREKHHHGFAQCTEPLDRWWMQVEDAA